MLNWTATLWPVMVAMAIKSAVVIGAAWMVTIAMRGCSAASRHVVWTACAAALLALPLLSVSVPALRLPAAGAILPGDPGLVFRSTVTAALLSGGAPNASPAATKRPLEGRAAAAAPADWRTVVLAVWAAGAAIVLGQMLLACMALLRMKRASRSHPEADTAALLAASLGIQEPVDIRERPEGMPMTFGLFRPTIFLPAEASDWSEARRRIVLLHELAHVRRGDTATHLIARAALALYWWNPMAWMAWREFLKEREKAADDLVLAAGAGQSEYAGHLLEVARTMRSAPAAAAAIAMARPSQLEGRLLAILADGVNRRQLGRGAAWIAAAMAIALVVPLAAIRAQSTAAPIVPPDVDAAIRSASVQKNHQLLEDGAKAYENLRKYNEAQALREASLAIREQESGKQSAAYAEGLVMLGDLARRRGMRPESLEYYRRALENGDRPEVVSALINLGLFAAGSAKAPQMVVSSRAGDPSNVAFTVRSDASQQEGNLAEAYDYLERARKVANNGNDMGRAMTWLAFIKSNEPQGETEADSLYRGAMAAEDNGGADQALTLEFYARFLRSHGRDGEADPIAARATQIRKARAAALGPKRTLAMNAVKVGPGMTAPMLLSKVEPSYSEEARAAKYQGTVTLQIVVDTDGTATDIQVVKSLGFGLDEKAVEAVMAWKFKPGTMGGTPVPVQAMIEVNFRLL